MHWFCFISEISLYILMQLSNAGGRLIIASDGVWDALTFDSALKCCHGLPAESAAKQIVKVGAFVSLLICIPCMMNNMIRL